MLARVHKTVAAGDDECDPSPTAGDDGRQLIFQGAELERTIPLPGARVFRLGGVQVAARHQLVAFDGGVVMDRPAVFAEALGVVLDTND